VPAVEARQRQAAADDEPLARLEAARSGPQAQAEKRRLQGVVGPRSEQGLERLAARSEAASALSERGRCVVVAAAVAAVALALVLPEPARYVAAGAAARLELGLGLGLELARRPRAAVAAAPSSPVPFPFAVPAAVSAVQPAAWEVQAVLPRAARAVAQVYAAVVQRAAEAHVVPVLRAAREAHAAAVLRAAREAHAVPVQRAAEEAHVVPVLRAAEKARAAVPRQVAVARGAPVAARWVRLLALPSAWVFPQVPPWPAPRAARRSPHMTVEPRIAGP
jgi:hypothetical protein